MRAIIQRVSLAKVEIDNKIYGEINQGLVVLIGIKKGDDSQAVEKMIKKIINLRIFNDKEGKMNLSVNDIKGDILIISNFTLYGNTKKGNRPSYIEAAGQEDAETIYDLFIQKINNSYVYKVAAGKFQADMKVSLINDGPVTLTIEI
jgi:D-tyrosyl-tRNA(Tyr) deacylase